MVRNKDGAGKAAGNATEAVDDTDSEPAEEFLHVTHQHELKGQADDELENSAKTKYP